MSTCIVRQGGRLIDDSGLLKLDSKDGPEVLVLDHTVIKQLVCWCSLEKGLTHVMGAVSTRS